MRLGDDAALSQNGPQHLPVKNLVIASVMTLQCQQSCCFPNCTLLHSSVPWCTEPYLAVYPRPAVQPVGGDLYWTLAGCQPSAAQRRKNMHRLPCPNLETSLRDGNQTLQTEAGGRHKLPFDLRHRETVWGMHSTYRDASAFC